MDILFTVNRQTGERSMEMEPPPLLPTELFESATARVRSVFLKSDGVHCTAVLDALRSSSASASHEVLTEVNVLVDQFQMADLG